MHLCVPEIGSCVQLVFEMSDKFHIVQLQDINSIVTVHDKTIISNRFDFIVI